MMSKMTQFNLWFPLGLRLVLGIIFLWSGWEKLGHMDLFYKAASDYHILSPQLTSIYSAALPWLEVLCGLYLVVGLFKRFTLVLTTGLMLSFIIAIAMVLMRGQSIDCGCFLGGTQPSPITPALLWRDLILFAAAAYLYFIPTTAYSLDNYLDAA
jgi:uncharacterized membrane protein YphA (DoxX/SURF4 family)